MTLQVAAIQSSFESQDGTKKWYPRIVKVGKTITSNDLAKDLADVSTLSIGDARNVFDNLASIIKKHLMNSQSVCIDDFGTFTVTSQARGTGVDTKEEVTPKQITGLKVRFTPTYTRSAFEGTTRAMYTGVTFEMYGSRSKSVLTGSDENNEGGGAPDEGDDLVDPDA